MAKLHGRADVDMEEMLELNVGGQPFAPCETMYPGRAVGGHEAGSDVHCAMGQEAMPRKKGRWVEVVDMRGRRWAGMVAPVVVT